MDEKRFLHELQIEMRIANLSTVIRPSFNVLEQALPHLIILLKQIAEDEKISMEFRTILNNFIQDNCYELYSIKNLIFEFNKLKDTGMHETEAIRFMQEMHKVIDCILEMSDAMGSLRLHTIHLEEFLHQDKTIR